MFCISFVVAVVYFMVAKRPMLKRRRGQKELSVEIPHSHPDYQVSEHLGDKQWLLKNGSAGESDSDDVEEWQPLKTLGSNGSKENNSNNTANTTITSEDQTPV